MQRRSFVLSATTALAATRIMGANQRVRLGLLGSGGRGQYVINLAVQSGRGEVVAVCDAYQPRMAQAKEKFAPQAGEFADYRQVLERNDIDAVLIGAPDHWHVPMLIDSVKAGKHVYCEKPVSHTVAEGELAIKAVQESGKVVQVGYQQRSTPHYETARKLVQEGRLGKVTMAQTYWYQNYQQRNPPANFDRTKLDWERFTGPSKQRPFEMLRFTTWRWFWDYGGGTMTDLYSHWGDVIHWFMGQDKPVSVQAMGSLYALDGLECPDTVSASLEYPGRFMVTYLSTMVSRLEDGGIVLRGTKGTMKLTRARFEIFPEGSSSNLGEPEIMERASKDGTAYHMDNFLDCVQSNKQPNSDIVSAVRSANAAHYANLSIRNGRMERPS